MGFIRRSRRYLCKNFVLFVVFIMFSSEMFYIHMNSSRITITDMDVSTFCSRLGSSNSIVLREETKEPEKANVNDRQLTDSPSTVGYTVTTTVRPIQTADSVSQPLTAAPDRRTPGTEWAPSKIIAGHQRQQINYMSIGIPTVNRNGLSYLIETLESIIENTSESEKSEVVVVVFLADMDFEFRAKTVQFIATTYMPHLESGFLQVVEPPFGEYPKFDIVKRNFNDTLERVRWRSKQVIDFAYLFMYCKQISKYYLNLEDDVITKPQFVDSIKQFIQAQSMTSWIVLDFSNLGFIGKLMRSENLEQFAKFLMLFYIEQPVDFLLRHFATLRLQQQIILRTPTLFQHIGEHSSLRGKIQNLKDNLFQPTQPQIPVIRHPKVFNGDNPPARISTSLSHYMNYLPENPYSKADLVFWSDRPGQAGDYFIIRFNDSVSLGKVAVETGSPDHMNDSIHNGILYASQEVQPHPTDGTSNSTASPSLTLVSIGNFVNGRVIAEGLDLILHTPVKFLCITISKNQTEWVLIPEIAVFTFPTNTTKGII